MGKHHRNSQKRSNYPGFQQSTQPKVDTSAYMSKAAILALFNAIPAVGAVPTTIRDSVSGILNTALTHINITTWTATNNTDYCQPEGEKDIEGQCFAYIYNAAQAAVDVVWKQLGAGEPESKSLYECVKRVVEENYANMLNEFSPHPETLTNCSHTMEFIDPPGHYSGSPNTKVKIYNKIYADLTGQLCNQFRDELDSKVTSECLPEFPTQTLIILGSVIAGVVVLCCLYCAYIAKVNQQQNASSSVENRGLINSETSERSSFCSRLRNPFCK